MNTITLSRGSPSFHSVSQLSRLDQIGLAQQQAVGEVDLGLGNARVQVQPGTDGVDQADIPSRI